MKHLFLICTLAVFTLGACGSEPPGTPVPDAGNDDLFRSLGRLVQPEPAADPVVVSLPVTNHEGGTVTVTTRYRAAPGFDELICMAPGSDTLWPGALIYGNSVPDGEYLPVITERAPLTFSVSLVNIQGTRIMTVPSPCLSAVRQSIGDLLSQDVIGSTPARTSFSISDVYSEEQLQIALGGNFGSGTFSVKSQFDFSNSGVQSRVLVKFAQVYYTIDIDLPRDPTTFFSDSSGVSNILARCGGISPVYVSSVSYGRLALFSFESGESGEELKTAITAAFNGITTKGEFSLTVRQQEILKNSIIKATIIGGNGGMAVHAINGIDGLKAFILTGGNYNRDNPGAPLAYRFRYLSDNATCKVVLASEYEVTRTWKAASGYRIYEMALHCDRENDAGNCEELYGRCTVRCTAGDTTIPGTWDGQEISPTIWDTDADHPWSLKEGQSRAFTGGRDFMVPTDRLDDAKIIITAHIREEDTFGDDDLGTRTMEIPVKDLTEGPFILEGFFSGLTRVSIRFRARPL